MDRTSGPAPALRHTGPTLIAGLLGLTWLALTGCQATSTATTDVGAILVAPSS